MARMIQCDACKKVVAPGESYFMRLWAVNRRDELIGATEKEAELCNNCRRKILNILNQEG